MTITLYWWMIPLVLVIFGVAFTYRPRQTSQYFDFDPMGIIVFLTSIGVSIGIIIGHFI